MPAVSREAYYDLGPADGYRSMSFSAKLRSLPWVPLTRLFYLTLLGWGVLTAGGISIDLLPAILIPLCPVLLHIALVVPRQHGIALKHPYIFRWIYGVPVLAVAVPWLLLGFSPTMGGHLGWTISFEVYESVLAASATEQAAMALACFGLVYVPAAQFARALRAEGWRAAGTRPLATLFALVCVPLSAGLSITFLSAAFNLPQTVPFVARVVSESVLQAASASANFIAVVVLPLTVAWFVFGGIREFLRDPLGAARNMASAEKRG